MDAQPISNGEVLRRDGIVGWHHDGHLRSSVCSLTLEAFLIRTLSTCISWRCMQNGNTSVSVWALALSCFPLFLLSPVLLLLF